MTLKLINDGDYVLLMQVLCLVLMLPHLPSSRTIRTVLIVNFKFCFSKWSLLLSWLRYSRLIMYFDACAFYAVLLVCKRQSENCICRQNATTYINAIYASFMQFVRLQWVHWLWTHGLNVCQCTTFSSYNYCYKYL